MCVFVHHDTTFVYLLLTFFLGWLELAIFIGQFLIHECQQRCHCKSKNLTIISPPSSMDKMDKWNPPGFHFKLTKMCVFSFVNIEGWDTLFSVSLRSGRLTTSMPLYCDKAIYAQDSNDSQPFSSPAPHHHAPKNGPSNNQLTLQIQHNMAWCPFWICLFWSS